MRLEHAPFIVLGGVLILLLFFGWLVGTDQCAKRDGIYIGGFCFEAEDYLP